ncbi:MAG: hypothetical protein WCK84_10745 [Bacteroidota bacterium]
MKISVILSLVLISGILVISGCGSENKDLKIDAKKIADVMCKSLETMKNLRTADPSDSLMVNKLQKEYKIVQSEMAILYQNFRTKYGEKAKSGKFNEDFRKYLNEAMLDCKSLSKEDREAFEKGSK